MYFNKERKAIQMDEVRILSPQGMLGYGFPKESFEAGIALKPHAICVDAGSTDGGPHKLGAGVGITSKKMVKRDIGMMLEAGLKNHIPVLVGSAGGSGGQPHIEWTLEVVQELARERGWKLKIAVIFATIDKQWLKEQVRLGTVTALPGVSELNDREVDLATEIVAQMGYESYLPALEQGVDLILAGRSYDPAMTAAVSVHYGMDVALGYHMGKILECGALCAVPGSAKDCMLGYIRKDSFDVRSLNNDRLCTPHSVAAHTLYEKGHPYSLPCPGGVSELADCIFEQIDPHTVRVSGSKFRKSEQYVVKLEGSKLSGYRSIFIAGIRDPLAIRKIDELLEGTHQLLTETFPEINDGDHFIDYKVYGRNGIMAEMEPQKEITSQELCVLVEVVAPTQLNAAAICAFCRSTMLHYHYKGRYSTAGNLAFPFAPSDFNVGEVYEFNVYHLVPVDDPANFFRTEYREIGGSASA